MMPPMFVTAKLILLGAIVFPITSIFIYSKLLLDIFWWKTIKYSPDLTLFYCHFVFDICCSYAMLQNMIIMFLSTTDFVWFFVEYPNSSFFIVWPPYMINLMRGFLVLIIEVDRNFATYFPIAFFKHRKRMPTYLIVIFIVSYGFVDASVMFFFCGGGINVPPGCISIICAFGQDQCYYNYWKMVEKIIYIIIIVLSLLLSFKLFVWNKIKKHKINNELRRANRLALIDTAMIILFALPPTMIASSYPDFYSTLGPINAFFKTMGFIIEGYLVRKNLIRKFSDESRSLKQTVAKVKNVVKTNSL